MKYPRWMVAVSGVGGGMLSSTAWAHTGHPDGTAWVAGLLHPLTGTDHMLAMLAVGLWAVLSTPHWQEALRIPLAFVAALLLGVGLAWLGMQLPFVEPVIMASLLLLGLLLASRVMLPSWVAVAWVSGFALFHGLAHGEAFSAGPAAWMFVAGMLVTTLTLHVCGVLVACFLKPRAVWLARAAGVGVSCYGAALLLHAAT